MTLQMNDFLKISKALENSFQSLKTEFSSEELCMEKLKKAKEEYQKAILHATIKDQKIVKFSND